MVIAESLRVRDVEPLSYHFAQNQPVPRRIGQRSKRTKRAENRYPFNQFSQRE